MKSTIRKQTNEMSAAEFEMFSRLIFQNTGVVLNHSNLSMLCIRLMKRMKANNINNYKDYYDFLLSAYGSSNELNHMIDSVTTHTTEFFRTPKHFEYLKRILPQVTSTLRFKTRKHINVWSAGCSTGEEAYSISMVLHDFFQDCVGDYTLYASDISLEALSVAKLGVYSEDSLIKIPIGYHGYFMRGKGEFKKQVRVIPEIRNKIVFEYFNLIEPEYIIPSIDIIFCRNVIIYFNEYTKKSLVTRFYNQLLPSGLLFIGPSETLQGMSNGFKCVAPTVYQKLK